jgi:hypothetical protein
MVGDTKERVEELLGAPRWRFAKGGQLTDELRKNNLLVWLFVPFRLLGGQQFRRWRRSCPHQPVVERLLRFRQSLSVFGRSGMNLLRQLSDCLSPPRLS